MKCVIYRRVSTDMQVEEGISLDMQKVRLEQYAESQGWVVVEDYCDEGFSAKNIDRPAFQRMIRDMEKGFFDIILVYRLDRFTRSVLDLHSLLDKMDKHNVKFKSSTEIFDTTTATGRMFITLVATLAQWERETTAERVRDSMQKKAELGFRNGAKPPMGYTLKNGLLYIDKDESEVVKYIFNEYKTKGVTRIVKALNNRGIKTKQGKPFNYDAVRYIINNPIYIGKIRWDDMLTDIAQKDFAPIIDIHTFNEVQKIQDNRKNGKVRLQNYFIFSNVLRCHRCGRHFLGNAQDRNGRVVMAYRCSSRHHKGICDMPQIPESELEKIFLGLLDSVIVSIDETPHVHIEIENVQEQYTKLLSKKDRLKFLYLEGDISQNEYKREMLELTKEESVLYKQINEKEEEVTITEIKEILGHLKNEWYFLSNESKKSAVNSLVELIKIDVTKKGRAGRSPIPPTIKIKDFKLK